MKLIKPEDSHFSDFGNLLIRIINFRTTTVFNLNLYCQSDGCRVKQFYMENSQQNQMFGLLEWFYGKFTGTIRNFNTLLLSLSH